MVDLAKIRKKGKKKEPVEEGNQATGQPGNPPPPPPSAPSHRSFAGAQDDKLRDFRESAGTRREGFAEEAAEVVAGDQRKVLTFVIAGEQYAVAIDNIAEIVTPRPVTRIPNADPSIVGIISLRGTIVTIVDVRARLRHPERGDGGDPRIIVAQRGGELAGFQVDRVLRVVKSEQHDIEPHPVVHASEQSEAVRGVFRQSGALTILLDLDKLLG